MLQVRRPVLPIMSNGGALRRAVGGNIAARRVSVGFGFIFGVAAVLSVIYLVLIGGLVRTA